MEYCNVCMLLSEDGVCEKCSSTSLQDAKENDPVYLLTTDYFLMDIVC